MRHGEHPSIHLAKRVQADSTRWAVLAVEIAMSSVREAAQSVLFFFKDLTSATTHSSRSGLFMAAMPRKKEYFVYWSSSTRDPARQECPNASLHQSREVHLIQLDQVKHRKELMTRASEENHRKRKKAVSEIELMKKLAVTVSVNETCRVFEK